MSDLTGALADKLVRGSEIFPLMCRLGGIHVGLTLVRLLPVCSDQRTFQRAAPFAKSYSILGLPVSPNELSEIHPVRYRAVDHEV